MYKSALVMMIALVAAPSAVHAHQISTYKIGNWYYSVSVGYLREPVIVDDLAALDISVYRCKTAPCPVGKNHEIQTNVGTPVAGLDHTLTLEIGKERATKTIPLMSQRGSIGKYTASFVPTETGLYTYRLFGKIDNVPVDLAFGCRSASDEELENMTHLALSYATTRLSEFGGVECPVGKRTLAFPSHEAESDTQGHDDVPLSGGSALVALVVALMSLGMSAYVMSKDHVGAGRSKL